MSTTEVPQRLLAEMDRISKDPLLNYGVKAMETRAHEFPGNALERQLAANLTGIAILPQSRLRFDRFMDEMWQRDADNRIGMGQSQVHDEVIVGPGLHAAIYCMVRKMMGKPMPLVLGNDGERIGGMFATSGHATFFTNSRNRAGMLSRPGDQQGLNVIPGSLVQPSMLSAEEYQRNTDIAFAIRLALAMSAKVNKDVSFRGVEYAFARDGSTFVRVMLNGDTIRCKRLILANGLGRERSEEYSARSRHVMTYREFLQHMDKPFPLRGMHRIAVIGAGDSARTVIEALCGQGPREHWSVPELDQPMIDWYGAGLQTTCNDYITAARTRYKKIGGLLPRQLSTAIKRAARVRVVPENRTPEAGFNCAYVDGRAYDLVVMATGFRQTNLVSMSDSYVANSGRSIARRSNVSEVYAIGTCANLPFSSTESNQALNVPQENYVAMWRLAPRTAEFAAMVDTGSLATVDFDGEEDPVY